MKRFFLALLLLALSAQDLLASNNMRKCLLLPITDSVEGVVGFHVFQKVEAYLKTSSWCQYKSNSNILNILSNYQDQLPTHLKNPEVLRVISSKTKVGSLIRVSLKNQPKGIEVGLSVYGENGVDVFFQEKTLITDDNVNLVAQAISSWLELYDKQIPYDGQIIGVLGNQFTIDIGKSSLIGIGQKLIITRPIRKRQHPLLKEIVEWDTEVIGRGKVFQVSDSQAQAQMISYESGKKLNPKDWVRLDKTQVERPIVPEGFGKDIGKDDFGVLGNIGLYGYIGSGSARSLRSNTDKKIGGTALGFGVNGEIFGTRNYFGRLELSRLFGTYSQEQGTVVNSSNTMSTSIFKLKAGYRYLPLGFFYGPRVEGYVGYGRIGYGLDTSTDDNFTEVTVKGLMLGLKGDIPVYKKYRLNLKIDAFFNPKYTEESSIYGEADSVSSYELGIGGNYAISSSMNIDAGFSYLISKPKFADSDEQTYKNSGLKLGATFSY